MAHKRPRKSWAAREVTLTYWFDGLQQADFNDCFNEPPRTAYDRLIIAISCNKNNGDGAPELRLDDPLPVEYGMVSMTKPLKQIRVPENPLFSIDQFTPGDEDCIVNLIRQSLDNFEEAGSVLAASFRRLENFGQTYTSEGSQYFVVRSRADGTIVGGAGLGPLAGLPTSEGIGEIRELVIHKDFRKQGLGANLLKHCLDHSKVFNYHRLYLETAVSMDHAQRLFRRFGFQPVTQKTQPAELERQTVPCYYMLELPHGDQSPTKP